MNSQVLAWLAIAAVVALGVFLVLFVDPAAMGAA